MQSHLPDLNNSQIEFHLLRSCLGLCKINYILRTVHPNHTMSRFTAFNAGLRHSLEISIHASLPNHAWQEAILPMRLGGLGFRQAKQLHQQLSLPVAILSENFIFLLQLCQTIGTTYFTTTTTSDASLSGYIPGEDEAHSHFRNILADFHKEVTTDLSSMSEKSLQSQIQFFANLKESRSLQDNARLNTVSSIYAAAWLRAIPNPKLGLATASHEFVIAVKLWLEIPIFPDFSKAIRCMCGHTIDSFGDHLLGCGHGSLRSRRHNALRDIIYHMLLVDDAGSHLEEHCSTTSFNRPGDVYRPNFTNGKPAYFDVSIWNTMQPSYIIPASTLAGAAAFTGEEEKDAHRQTNVEASTL